MSRTGWLDGVKLLLDESPPIDPTGAVNGYGRTALEEAIIAQKTDVVKLLVEHPLNVYVRERTMRWREPNNITVHGMKEPCAAPLELAVETGNAQLVAAVLAGEKLFMNERIEAVDAEREALVERLPMELAIQVFETNYVFTFLLFSNFT